ncbi:MAG: YraN family protein [Candidatus Peribacteraceae bacterium]|nr:YraN family protein [Candidatus Peribacteraceae bacterium]
MTDRWHGRDLNRKISRCAKFCASTNQPNKKQHLVIGKQGEQIAQNYLVSLKYEIRDTNIRIKRDEIDIIAYDPFDNVLVFAEVKTRSKYRDDLSPSVNMTTSKRIKLCRSARRWVCNHAYDGGYRIDLIYVAGGKVIQHVKEMEWID